MSESPGVDAFIRARQGQVLERAIATLDGASAMDLAAEAHRLAGTLGTFGLGDAAAVARSLEDALLEPGVTGDQVAQARAAALRSLEELAAGQKER